jgi:23S rRNA pseudouridine1911/1915/1917 synthase
MSSGTNSPTPAPIVPAHDGDMFLVPFVVEPNYAGWRLDKYLGEKLRRLSRTRIQAIIEKDLVFERRLKPSSLVWPGMQFSLRRKVQAEPTVPGPEAIGLIYQDDDLLVVDKPAGLPMHPTARYHHGTLVSQLKLRFGATEPASPAHRLDRETSGIVVCGRTLKASQVLGEYFQSGQVKKEYLAVVEGATPPTFAVDAPIAEGTDLIRISVRIDREVGKPAQTTFETIEHREHDGVTYSLLRCRPQTGRQHQIRIHAKEAGYPLVGDKMYGADANLFDRFTKGELTDDDRAMLRLSRHALHASRIEFQHPSSRHPLEFSSSLPEDLAAFFRGDNVKNHPPD